MNATAGSLLALTAALWAISPAHAAEPSNTPDAVYKREVARCNAGMSAQDRKTCLREAGAARDEAKRNRLSTGSTSHEQNRTRRCDALPALQRQDCITQMTDPANTTTRGSVDGGGVMRETVIPVPAGTPGSTMQNNLPPAGTPSGLQPAAAPMR
ncbi:putative exported protein [Bordetella holmesii 30539]|uniref:Exported protein n=1 Tax=Bordetella holmesii 1058 TaxID=1247648 RepID=A0ABN0RYL6_9BORD|nr:putative exported protein [Bordetella holmesii 44057]EWM41133.1 putative exported protein [Bordetella holmesii 35009]EWM42793.1 putative exported protein [Bordetella holmesii 41130]EWM45021.1 putative exported protein [Bordetella holmesii 70147]EXF88342.1 putative exported protein [Bordetella holmesii 30539]EXX94343.1 putative exported protein [Bordetella holmesii 1058]KAK95406.1 hypothetical protein L499_A1502 [Bordetella holmesii CDC-H635-BH]KCV05237.1 hypothetical protein L501_1474 [Bo